MIYAVIGGLVALVIALYYNAQQKALRLSQLHKELRNLTEQLESTQQQLKIKEKLYEGSYRHWPRIPRFF
jgi:sensor domain CHASE-containing protein